MSVRYQLGMEKYLKPKSVSSLNCLHGIPAPVNSGSGKSVERQQLIPLREIPGIQQNLDGEGSRPVSLLYKNEESDVHEEAPSSLKSAPDMVDDGEESEKDPSSTYTSSLEKLEFIIERDEDDILPKTPGRDTRYVHPFSSLEETPDKCPVKRRVGREQDRLQNGSNAKRQRALETSMGDGSSTALDNRWTDCDDAENELRLFDLNLQFGPCIGITRVSDESTSK